MTATFFVGDAIEVMSKLPEQSVDLILTSPPFLALRSYLPADHPDKALEGGSQATPGAFIDWLIDVVEACDRVLAPHGSLCIELGDTYAGASGSDDPKQPINHRGPWKDRPLGDEETVARRLERQGYGPAAAHNETQWRGGGGWPLGKSLSLIPELFRLTLVYGTNPLTGRQTERWRLRNVVRWVRPNPPVGALGDKFRPATSELMVFCKSAKRYFDLDAVREPVKHPLKSATTAFDEDGNRRRKLNPYNSETQSAGAPPLDWWNIPLLEGEEETRYGPKEPAKIERPRNRQAEPSMNRDGRWHSFPNVRMEQGGAPPLDWWKIPGATSNLRRPCEHGEYAEHQWEIEGRLANDTFYCPGGDFVNISPPEDGYSSPHLDGGEPLDWWNIPPGGYVGSHYAVFPPELCIKPIKAMCPEKVCRVCGEPSRRIVATQPELNGQQSLADEIASRRKATGVSRAEMVAWFPHYKNGESVMAQVSNWELAKNVPSPGDWEILKERLGVSDTFDELVNSDRRWTESEVTYEHVSDYPSGNTQDATGRVYQRLASRKDRIPPDRFSDCGHNDWRPGLVLDPFGGSGTTALVATGHGRDCILVDIDERNYELALQRVGPFILSRAESV